LILNYFLLIFVSFEVQFKVKNLYSNLFTRRNYMDYILKNIKKYIKYNLKEHKDFFVIWTFFSQDNGRSDKFAFLFSFITQLIL
jgi:hypothetical protein